MKYAMCPKCGRRLCKGENGTKVEMECPKCGAFASVIIEEDDVHISRNPIFTIVDNNSVKIKQHA
ncbi:MAG: Com family DNA-binding transcriptional regulator [Clostridiales bacterium]|nr:MAG: Com family DNA-binding transcriptional regulator [Clostridiales bacterium]